MTDDLDDLLARLDVTGHRPDEMANHYMRRMEIERREAAKAIRKLREELAAAKAWTKIQASILTAPADPQPDAHNAAIRDVIAERQRQIAEEGWTPQHDDQHDMGQMASAAACYAAFTEAFPKGCPSRFWPWAAGWWKPTNRRRNLVKAGALLLAEIERLDRAALLRPEGGE